MKNEEKNMIFILTITAIAIITILLGIRLQFLSNEQSNTEKDELVGSYTKLMEDGSKVNVSKKLQETKFCGNYEISNIKLTERGGETVLTADVKNIGTAKLNEKILSIKLINEKNITIAELRPMVTELEVGQSTSLNTSIMNDVCDIYDFSIKLLN